MIQKQVPLPEELTNKEKNLAMFSCVSNDYIQKIEDISVEVGFNSYIHNVK